MKATIFAVLMLALAGLAQAQTHNVVLTWQNTTCTATIVTNCNPVGTTFNAYKTLGTCPAPGTAPSTVTPPFASFATGITVTDYTDANAIQVGQSWCYYVTAVYGTKLNSAGAAVPNESGPSNYAQATIVPPTAPPMVSPTVLSVVVQ